MAILYDEQGNYYLETSEIVKIKLKNNTVINYSDIDLSKLKIDDNTKLYVRTITYDGEPVKYYIERIFRRVPENNGTVYKDVKKYDGAWD